MGIYMRSWSIVMRLYFDWYDTFLMKLLRPNIVGHYCNWAKADAVIRGTHILCLLGIHYFLGDVKNCIFLKVNHLQLILQ